jgi:putative FmdB family regulatory protein
MPTYDYHCKECGHQAEITQKISEPALETCPKCNKKAFKRGPGGGIGLAFKGSGFYINDYARPSSEPSEKPSSCNPSGCCPCNKNTN